MEEKLLELVTSTYIENKNKYICRVFLMLDKTLCTFYFDYVTTKRYNSKILEKKINLFYFHHRTKLNSSTPFPLNCFIKEIRYGRDKTR